MIQVRPEITLDPRKIRVLFGGHEVAESDQVRLVREAGEQPALYFPRKDVEMTILARTDLNIPSRSKGVATHFTIYRDATVIENAAWSFEDPPLPFQLIAGHIVFHPAHFDFAEHGKSPADWSIEIASPAPSRAPGTSAITFVSADELASALQRAAAAHHLHEAQTPATDADWPTWYASYILSEQAGRGAPVEPDDLTKRQGAFQHALPNLEA